MTGGMAAWLIQPFTLSWLVADGHLIKDGKFIGTVVLPDVNTT
jgi:hypothetical protein